MKYPNLWRLEALVDHVVNGGVSVGVNGQYAPARPYGFASFGQRLKCAWLVFTGKADAVTWPLGQ